MTEEVFILVEGAFMDASGFILLVALETSNTLVNWLTEAGLAILMAVKTKVIGVINRGNVETRWAFLQAFISMEVEAAQAFCAIHEGLAFWAQRGTFPTLLAYVVLEVSIRTLISAIFSLSKFAIWARSTGILPIIASFTVRIACLTGASSWIKKVRSRTVRVFTYSKRI